MKLSDPFTVIEKRTTAQAGAPTSGLLVAFPRTTALVLLLVGITLEQPAIDLGVVTVKPEHLLLVFLWLVIGWRLITASLFREARLLRWVALYLAILLLASFLTSPEPAVSLRHTIMVALVASAAWLAYAVANTRQRLLQAAELLVWLATAEAALIFLSLGLAWIGVPLGAQAGRGGIAVPNGTLWEPNLLGSYLAAGGVLALASLVSATNPRRAICLAGALTIITTALGLSLSRGAWLGFGGGVAVLVTGQLIVRLGHKRSEGAETLKRNLLLAALSGCVAAFFLVLVAPTFFPSTSAGLGNRLNLGAYDPHADPSLRARVDTLQQALPDIQAQPIIGHGAGSFGLSHLNEKGEPGWIANLELHMLYDSGVLGLSCWLIGLVGLGWAALRFLRGLSTSTFAGGMEYDFACATLGLLSSMTAIFIAFQATEGSWLAFPWVYLGLLVSAFSLSPSRINNALL